MTIKMIGLLSLILLLHSCHGISFDLDWSDILGQEKEETKKPHANKAGNNIEGQRKIKF